MKVKTPSIELMDFLQRLLHAQALLHLIRHPDSNQLAVVFGQKPIALRAQTVALACSSP